MAVLSIELFFAVTALMLFRYKNENKLLINTISIFLLITLASREIMSMTPYGYIVYKVGVMGLGVSYWNRFKIKKKKKLLDYVKCIILVMMALYPLNSFFFSEGSEVEKLFLFVFTALTIIGLAIIF